MRLPPPARRYSPISVIARTLEMVSRPNSSSSATRSSRSRSNTSLPLMVAGALKIVLALLTTESRRRNGFLCTSGVKSSVRSVVYELQIDSEIVPSQQLDHFLQGVAILAADPNQIALDRCLRFFLRVLYQLHNVSRLFNCNPLLQGGPALRGSTGCRFDRSIG